MANTSEDVEKEVKRLFEELKPRLYKHLGPELVDESVEVYEIRRLMEDIGWAFVSRK